MSSVIRTLKEPGSIRIMVGGLIVAFFVLSIFLGQFLCHYTPQQMDPDHIMEPPSLGFFRGFLITEKGLKNLQKSPGSFSPANPDGNNLDHINDIVDELIASEAIKAESAADSSNFPAQNAEKEKKIKRVATVAPQPDRSVERTPEGEDLDYLSNDGPLTPEANAKSPKRHKHYFGTDKDGRDILALILAGAKTSLIPGIIACLVALGIGIPLGLIGGYYGGFAESFIQFLNSMALSIPRLVLILVVICAVEPNLYYVMIVLGITIIPRVSELIKARVKILRNMGFVLAAKEAGLTDLKIMLRHLLWYQNRTVCIIQASLIMSEAILVETTLSYLQFGAKPPDVSWGSIIEGSRLAFFSEYYWITFFPALTIVAAILGFFYLADGLNARLSSREQN